MGRVLTRRESSARVTRVMRLVVAMRYLGDKCAFCGVTDRNVLHFDHVDRTAKIRNVTAMVTWRWCRLRNELDKCQLLCANCHCAKSRREASQDADLPLVNLNDVLVSSSVESLVEGGAGELEVVTDGLELNVSDEGLPERDSEEPEGLSSYPNPPKRRRRVSTIRLFAPL